MSDVHSKQWWDTNNRHARVDRATLEREIAYEQAKLAAKEWCQAQLAKGKHLSEIVPTLRIKYLRAWRAFVRGEA